MVYWVYGVTKWRSFCNFVCVGVLQNEMPEQRWLWRSNYFGLRSLIPTAVQASSATPSKFATQNHLALPLGQMLV